MENSVAPAVAWRVELRKVNGTTCAICNTNPVCSVFDVSLYGSFIVVVDDDDDDDVVDDDDDDVDGIVPLRATLHYTTLPCPTLFFWRLHFSSFFPSPFFSVFFGAKIKTIPVFIPQVLQQFFLHCCIQLLAVRLKYLKQKVFYILGSVNYIHTFIRLYA